MGRLIFGTVLGTTMVAFGGLSRSPANSELPPRFLANSVICREDRAIFMGGERGPHLASDPRLFEQQAVVFEIRRGENSPRRLDVGPGFIADASHPEGHTIYAVRRETLSDQSERAFLLRSSDFGETWHTVESAPKDVAGVAFETSTSGYVWSSATIYRTTDQGASWRAVDAPGVISNPKPVVDSGGVLWVATAHAAAWDRDRNRIARVMPDLRVETALQPGPLRVWMLDLAESGEAWLLAESDRRDITLQRLSPSKEGSPLNLVSDLPFGLPNYLRVRDPEIVVALADIHENPGQRSLLTSSDGGVSWRRIQLPEPGVRLFCAVNANNVWMLGSSGSVYSPR